MTKNERVITKGVILDSRWNRKKFVEFFKKYPRYDELREACKEIVLECRKNK